MKFHSFPLRKSALFLLFRLLFSGTALGGFHETMIATDLHDPMEISVAPGGDVYVIEREGRLLRVHPPTGAVHVVGGLRVSHYRKVEEGSPWGRECGLLGIALAQDFAATGHLFLYYSHPDKLLNHLSRFTVRNGLLDNASELVLLTVETERDKLSTHMAGSLLMGADGCLYLSTGDNTNPFESNGHAPIDDRLGHETANAMRASGNTNDLRGKILRIRPTATGCEIPPGNLFPPGMPSTRPEIFVMGCRNPFRLSMDEKSHTIYWGEVGPDANAPSDRGPQGFDEINQASTAGNYGWPFVIADNKPYPMVDFTSGAVGAMTDPAAPQNPSQFNTGLKVLPPARPAFIWYPYAESPEFPLMGSGGRNAMVGPVCYFDEARRYNLLGKDDDRTLLTYDWMRGRAWKVKLDEAQKFVRMEPLLDGLMHPIDMAFAADGALYVLEYGSEWYWNKNGRLRRILPDQAQPPPSISIEENPPRQFTATASQGTEVRWYLTAGQQDEPVGNGTTFTLTRSDAREVRAVATDSSGHCAVARRILDDATVPQLTLTLAGSPSKAGFGSTLEYQVQGAAEPGSVVTRVRYIPPTGHDAGGPALPDAVMNVAKERLCFACHQVDMPSVGPRYVDVALRYRDDPDALGKLIAKLKTGGAGAWGQIPMPPQVALSQMEADTIIPAILRLADGMSETRGASGNLRLPAATDTAAEGGAWEITAEAPGHGRAKVRIVAEMNGASPKIAR